MRAYQVRFFKYLLNSSGHGFRCPQQLVPVQANNPKEALQTAQREFERRWNISDWRLHADEAQATAADEELSQAASLSAESEQAQAARGDSERAETADVKGLDDRRKRRRRTARTGSSTPVAQPTVANATVANAATARLGAARNEGVTSDAGPDSPREDVRGRRRP